MPKLKTARGYALITGIILFAFGFFNLAFRVSSDIPGYYLFLSMILGVWGIVVSTKGG